MFGWSYKLNKPRCALDFYSKNIKEKRGESPLAGNSLSVNFIDSLKVLLEFEDYEIFS